MKSLFLILALLSVGVQACEPPVIPQPIMPLPGTMPVENLPDVSRDD